MGTVIEASSGVYSEEALEAALRKDGREERYRMYVLTDGLVRLGSVAAQSSVRVDMTAAAEIKRSVSFSVLASDAAMCLADRRRVQPAMQLRMPDGNWVEWPLGVYLPITPTQSAETGLGRGMETIEGYDQGVILRDDKLLTPLTIAADTNYLSAVYDQLSAAGIARARAEPCEKAIPETLQFDLGTPRLDVVNTLLTAINYNEIWFDGDGYARLEPYRSMWQRRPTHVYNADRRTSVMLRTATVSRDTYDVPNIIVGTVSRTESDALTSTWRNDNPDSALSVARRGRRVVHVEDIEDIADQATLDAYVQRLGEQALESESTEFTTLNMPTHGIGDMIYVSRADLKLDACYVETEWHMELKTGGGMRHNVKRTVTAG
jgi:hypothetical protein